MSGEPIRVRCWCCKAGMVVAHDPRGVALAELLHLLDGHLHPSGTLHLQRHDVRRARVLVDQLRAEATSGPKASATTRAPYKSLGAYPSMALPPGKTCGDCVHLARCVAMFGHQADDEVCDWDPSRFREATPMPSADHDRTMRFALEIVWHSKRRDDHACAQCVPDGPIVVPGFQCVFHEADQFTSPEPEKKT